MNDCKPLAGGDVAKARAMAPTILELNDISKERWRNDYDVNKSLRRAMRGQRKDIAENKAETKAAGLPEHMRWGRTS